MENSDKYLQTLPTKWSHFDLKLTQYWESSWLKYSPVTRNSGSNFSATSDSTFWSKWLHLFFQWLTKNQRREVVCVLSLGQQELFLRGWQKKEVKNCNGIDALLLSLLMRCSWAEWVAFGIFCRLIELASPGELFCLTPQCN